MHNISSRITTPRLEIAISDLGDLARLKELYASFCQYMEPLNGNRSWHADDVERSLKEGDLPPHGEKERYQHLTIRDRATRDIVGFAELYNGYPHDDVYYVGALYIDPQYQRRGLGAEFVEAIYQETRRLGFSSLRLALDLKNWPAVHFWCGLGFDTITKVVGDKTIGENAFLKVEIGRSIVGLKL